jgi:hypothetical protein
MAWLPAHDCAFRGLVVLDDMCFTSPPPEFHRHHHYNITSRYVNEEMQNTWARLPTNAKFDVSQHGTTARPCHAAALPSRYRSLVRPRVRRHRNRRLLSMA